MWKRVFPDGVPFACFWIDFEGRERGIIGLGSLFGLWPLIHASNRIYDIGRWRAVQTEWFEKISLGLRYARWCRYRILRGAYPRAKYAFFQDISPLMENLINLRIMIRDDLTTWIPGSFMLPLACSTLSKMISQSTTQFQVCPCLGKTSTVHWARES